MGGEFKETNEEKNTFNKGDICNQKKLNKEQLENLLKKGIIGLLNEEEEKKKSNEYFGGDIDEILKNNTRLAEYSIIKGNYSVSKGFFASNKHDSDLKIDDPNFWNKILNNSESKTSLALKELE